MRHSILLCFLLTALTGTVMAAPHITGILTGYPNLSSSVTIKGTLWGPGVAYGMAQSPITIVGSSFGLDATVTFPKVPTGDGVTTVNAVVISWDDTTIQATVPANAGTGTVVVTVGGQTSNAMPFIVTGGSYNSSCTLSGGSGAPVINSLSPNSGGVGVLVGISGLHFGKEQGTSAVTLNGIPAFTTDWGDNNITIVVPQGASSGYVQVIVRGVQSNTIYFSVTTSNSCIIALVPRSLLPAFVRESPHQLLDAGGLPTLDY